MNIVGLLVDIQVGCAHGGRSGPLAKPARGQACPPRLEPK